MNKTTKKISVSVGIPAYNEEKNISRLLRQILRQKGEGFILEKIIVVDDASEDKTGQRIKSIADPRILLLQNTTRKGQSYCQNVIFNTSTSDAVVLLEADVLPIDTMYVSNLIYPIKHNRTIGLVQGNLIPTMSSTIVEKVLQKQAEVYHWWDLKRLNPAHAFSSGRGGRAFSQAVYKRLLWPSHVPEDMYASLWCQQRKIKVVFQKNATCTFRLPQTMSEFVETRKKIIGGYRSLLSHFDKDLVDPMCKRTVKEEIFMIIHFFIIHPIYFFFYASMKVYADTFTVSSNYTDYWQINYSTKNLPKFI